MTTKPLPTPPTTADLDKWQDAADRATPGPWSGNSLGDGTVEINDARGTWLSLPQYGPSKYQCCRDADFIEHAREAVPRLITEVRRLRAEMQRFVTLWSEYAAHQRDEDNDIASSYAHCADELAYVIDGPHCDACCALNGDKGTK